MEFKLLKEKDYTIDLASVRYRGQKVMPTVKVKVTDKETGELHEDCDMNITSSVGYDDTPFVKLYRPNLIDELGRGEFRLFCYVMEKMNRYNVVEIDAKGEEVYEYTGYTHRSQVYSAIRVMREKSVLWKETTMPGVWKVNEECMKKYMDTKKEDKKPFVKIYSPRTFLALTSPERALLYYICVKMDFEGIVNVRMHDFLELTGYKHRNERDGMGRMKSEPNAVALSRARQGLKKKGFVRDVAVMVAEGWKPKSGTYFRVNPNILFRGNRMRDGKYNLK